MQIISLEKAAEYLIKGKIGVMPTDTVYGLVASAHDAEAVKRMYAVKHREQKPGTLIAANIQQLLDLGVPLEEINKVAMWWPNPISAILPITGHGYLHQDVGTLAMRIVNDPMIRDILESTGPLITSSANTPGEPPATTSEEAVAYFGDAVDFYVDGGVIADVAPSTIIRPARGGIEVVRAGAMKVT